jgi:hypothetical protein
MLKVLKHKPNDFSSSQSMLSSLVSLTSHIFNLLSCVFKKVSSELQRGTCLCFLHDSAASLASHVPHVHSWSSFKDPELSGKSSASPQQLRQEAWVGQSIPTFHQLSSLTISKKHPLPFFIIITLVHTTSWVFFF